MGKSYNFIYKKLVTDDNDLIGLIAYGLYKQHKIEFIRSYRESHNDSDPSESDCEAFALSSCAPTQLKQYRDSAETLLQQITLEATREEIKSFEDNMLHQYRSEIEKALTSRNLSDAISSAVEKSQPEWWLSVLWSVVGAFVFSLIAALFIFIGSTSEKSTAELVKYIIQTSKTVPAEQKPAVDSICAPE
ncbi:MAG: hypothetical protein NC212_08720 [Staphylococcus sp.]|nr:hypothetical protein [Staphylococcus sp.]